MADVSPPPVGGLVGWILGGIAAALGIVWAALQSGRAKEIARLEAALEHERKERANERERNERERRDEREEHRKDLQRLGERIDEEARARRVLELRSAGVVMRVHQDPNIDDALVEDMPTGVHHVAALIQAGSKDRPELDERLRRYARDESTPTGLRAPRPRLPSRPK